MPTLVLKVAPLQNPERYRQLARALTDLTVQWLGKRREVTAVVIDDLPAARWHIGSEPAEHATALLEISVRLISCATSVEPVKITPLTR
eukprot:gene39521-48834_t